MKSYDEEVAATCKDIQSEVFDLLATYQFDIDFAERQKIRAKIIESIDVYLAVDPEKAVE